MGWIPNESWIRGRWQLKGGRTAIITPMIVVIEEDEDDPEALVYRDEEAKKATAEILRIWARRECSVEEAINLYLGHY